MYALVHNNQIVVGPRQWSALFFTRWLSDNLNLNDVVLQEEKVPIVIDTSTKLLKVTSLLTPECNHKIQQYSGPHWTIHSTHITGEYSLADKDIDLVKNELKNIVATKRYEKEIGGLDLGDGTIIKTDPESQAKVTGAWARVQRKQNVLIDWKGSNGWVKLNKTAIENLADAIGDHVQNCFTLEKEKNDEIDTCATLEELNAINLELE